MTITVEEVKSMIRARIDDEREKAAEAASRNPVSADDELRALRHWSDVHLHNQVLRRLLADIEEAESKYPDSLIVESLPLHPATKGILRRAGFITVLDLACAKDIDLLRIPAFGFGRLKEVRKIIPCKEAQ